MVREKGESKSGQNFAKPVGLAGGSGGGELEVVGSNAEKFSGPKKAAVPVDPGVAEKVGTAPRKPEVRLS